MNMHYAHYNNGLKSMPEKLIGLQRLFEFVVLSQRENSWWLK
jgi:hypothetical protein